MPVCSVNSRLNGLFTTRQNRFRCETLAFEMVFSSETPLYNLQKCQTITIEIR